MKRFSTALALVVVVACSLPAHASAHGGVTAPAATSFHARLGSVPRGLQAKIVDGDQRLWMRAEPAVTAVVLGFQGEPFLRFSESGVVANTRSPTYWLNRSRPLSPPSMDLRGAPAWRVVARGRSYSWHEGRLHSLAASARAPGSPYVGRWTVPVVVDGRRTQISGGLWHADSPSLLWFWPAVVLLASLPALIRLRRPRLDAAVATLLAAATLLASTAGRLGRELYGRPFVSSWQLVLVAVTCLFALGMALLFVSPRWRLIGAVLIALTGLYEGLALIGTLRHGFVLAALPATVERVATATALAGGLGLLFVTVAVGVPAREEDEDTAREPRELELVDSVEPP